MSSDFSELVAAARSVRRYRGDLAVPEEALERWVDLARITPSGMNAQVLRYRIVTQEDICAKLYESVMWAGALKDWPGPEPSERPRAYIAIFSEGKGLIDIDLGIAAQTIMLAARAEGFGACMFKSFRPERLAEILDVDASAYQPLLLMSFGVPAEEVVLEEAAPNDSLAYWRDANAVHHVPKRALSEVLI